MYLTKYLQTTVPFPLNIDTYRHFHRYFPVFESVQGGQRVAQPVVAGN